LRHTDPEFWKAAMKITRKFTKEGTNPFASTEWTKRSSRISNPDGSVVFEMKDAEVPDVLEQLATDIMVSKYFRKAGVPRWDRSGPSPVPGDGKNAGRRKRANGPSAPPPGHPPPGAGCWRHWGETHGYFDSKPRTRRRSTTNSPT
jgi:ribonucleoside-diphosphate reductase alpha chain